MADQCGVVRRGGVNIGAYQASATANLLTAPDTVQSGVAFDVVVTAVDPFGLVAVGYTGTVTFTTTDPNPAVVLPTDYSFTLDDGGIHTFTDTGLAETTLINPDDQTLTVTDTADAMLTGGALVTVEPGPAPAARIPSGSYVANSVRSAAPVQGGTWHPAIRFVDHLFAVPADKNAAVFSLLGDRQDPGEAAGDGPDLFSERAWFCI